MLITNYASTSNSIVANKWKIKEFLLQNVFDGKQCAMIYFLIAERVGWVIKQLPVFLTNISYLKTHVIAITLVIF